MAHISQEERGEIAILLNKKYTYDEIGIALGRDGSVIRREVKRNSVKWQYVAKKAHMKAYQRRHRCKKPLKKIRMHDECEKYVRTQLRLYRWAPEQIAHWRNENHGEYTISHTIVYQYIYSRFGYGLTEYLYTQRKRPRKRKNIAQPVRHIPNRVTIDARPKIISLQQEYGHYEVDLIVSPKYGSNHVLLTLVDKMTRWKVAYKLTSRSPQGVKEKLLEAIKKFSIRSMTFDNGFEFMYHHKLNIPTYFCHPYHSREKGQIEYTNRLYRIFIPKWTDLCKYSQDEIDIITQMLNDRPMRCLAFAAPSRKVVPYLSIHSLHLTL